MRDHIRKRSTMQFLNAQLMRIRKDQAHWCSGHQKRLMRGPKLNGADIIHNMANKIIKQSREAGYEMMILESSDYCGQRQYVI